MRLILLLYFVIFVALHQLIRASDDLLLEIKIEERIYYESEPIEFKLSLVNQTDKEIIIGRKLSIYDGLRFSYKINDGDLRTYGVGVYWNYSGPSSIVIPADGIEETILLAYDFDTEETVTKNVGNYVFRASFSPDGVSLLESNEVSIAVVEASLEENSPLSLWEDEILQITVQGLNHAKLQEGLDRLVGFVKEYPNSLYANHALNELERRGVSIGEGLVGGSGEIEIVDGVRADRMREGEANESEAPDSRERVWLLIGMCVIAAGVVLIYFLKQKNRESGDSVKKV